MNHYPDSRDATNIVVFGQSLRIKGKNENPERINEIARYVHEVMMQVDSENPGHSLVDTAILTALNLTNLLLFQQAVIDSLRHRIDSCNARLNDYLKEETPAS